MTFKEYMQSHEVAVRQLFDSLAYYHGLIQKSIPPCVNSDMVQLDIDATDEDIEQAYSTYYDEHPEFRDKQIKSNKGWQAYKANVLAHATICGSILQVSYMALSLFSKYDEECKCLNGKHKKFGIGRIIRGIPQGLIIYAGRNQYNHWDSETMHKATTCIFNLVAEGHGCDDIRDPSFDLNNRYLKIYSHNILGLMGWNSYSKYSSDMLNMLAKYEKEEV